MSPNLSGVSGACSAGFRTQEQPAASAGASFHAAIRMGTFQGMIRPGDPDRLPQRVGQGGVTAGCDLAGVSLEGTSQQAGVVAEAVRRGLHLSAGVLQRHPGVQGFEQAQLTGLVLDAVGHFVQHRGALGGIPVPPVTRFEGAPRRSHGAVHIGLLPGGGPG